LQAAAAQMQQRQRDNANLGLGAAQIAAASNNCIQCGAAVSPGVDRLTTRDGGGPYCPNCWAHTWIAHKFRNIDDGPACSMGVRFTDPEWRAIQKAIWDTMIDIGGKLGRFPRGPGELDVILGAFKFSQVCRTCGGNIPYALSTSDLKIAGVNQPWPPNRALPWAQPQLAGR
jgi:hypothetical protein